MTSRLVRLLTCNKPGCGARFIHGTARHLTPPTVLRHSAHAAGWTTKDTHDYCPSHQPWPGVEVWAVQEATR